MEELVKATGVIVGIQHCFSEVFGELNLVTESWVHSANLLTFGRDNYADFISRRIGLFPLFATSRTASVESAFIKVSVTPEIERERYRSKEHIAESLRSQKDGQASADPRFDTSFSGVSAIETGDEGFALIGNAGSGKTTLFRAITIHAARGHPIRGIRRIPVFIAARDIRAEQPSIVEEVVRFFAHLNIPLPERIVTRMLDSGRLMVLVDGIDESDLVTQRELVNDLQLLRARYPKAVIAVSSRPYSLSLGLAGFQKWETLPLEFDDRLNFVRKWYYGVNSAKGETLVETSQDRPEILDLGSSPLLLSIVCALFNNDLDIPKEPEELYERAIHGILGGWDAFRNIARDSPLAGLSIKKRTVLLTVIAINLFEEGKLVFSVEDVVLTDCLKSAASLLRVELPEPEILLRSLYNDFGLLIERAPNLYSFSHLTLEEFLAACYIVDNRRERQLLSEHAHDFEWAEIIRMTARLQPNADEFLTLLVQSTRLHALVDMLLLRDVFLSRPICTPELRRNLMAGLAREFARAANATHAKFSFGTTSGNKGELIVRVAPRKDFAKIDKLIHDGARAGEATAANQRDAKMLAAKKEKGVAQYLHWRTVANCFPVFLEIIGDSGYSFDELGVARSSVYRPAGLNPDSRIERVRVQMDETVSTGRKLRK